MEMMPHIFTAKVMHKRLFPKVNAFTYGVYYLASPLQHIQSMADGWRFGVNRRGLLAFYAKDHGARDDTPLEDWARNILAQEGVEAADGPIVLVCLPRVLGYVFNPVSFWLCFDREEQLRAVIAEVNNTFGETHSYLCRHEDGRPMHAEDWLHAKKLFHVSPFLEREGSYRFRFQHTDKKLGIWIDFFHANGEKQLVTALTGTLSPYSRHTRSKAFWQHPLVTFKTILLIHWQALKLVAKGIRYIPKPKQLLQRHSTTHKP